MDKLDFPQRDLEPAILTSPRTYFSNTMPQRSTSQSQGKKAKLDRLRENLTNISPPMTPEEAALQVRLSSEDRKKPGLHGRPTTENTSCTGGSGMVAATLHCARRPKVQRRQELDRPRLSPIPVLPRSSSRLSQRTPIALSNTRNRSEGRRGKLSVKPDANGRLDKREPHMHTHELHKHSTTPKVETTTKICIDSVKRFIMIFAQSRSPSFRTTAAPLSFKD
jgi:hypothetical protein